MYDPLTEDPYEPELIAAMLASGILANPNTKLTPSEVVKLYRSLRDELAKTMAQT